MRTKRRHNADGQAEVSLSPLIDCVFLLLIFFLVSTMLREIKRDIDIQLPESEATLKLRPEPAQVVIGIDAQGRFFYEGQQTTVTVLLANLGDLAAVAPDRRIRLDIDRTTPIESVVEVMHACQFRGLTNIGIRTYDRYYN